MRKHCLSANHRDAILWTNASSGVGNSSAQTVDDHVLVNGPVPLRGSKNLIAFGVLDDNGLDGV